MQELMKDEWEIERNKQGTEFKGENKCRIKGSLKKSKTEDALTFLQPIVIEVFIDYTLQMAYQVLKYYFHGC